MKGPSAKWGERLAGWSGVHAPVQGRPAHTDICSAQHGCWQCLASVEMAPATASVDASVITIWRCRQSACSCARRFHLVVS